jgi:hypothetical protein
MKTDEVRSFVEQLSQLCPGCQGLGFKAEYRYCGKCSTDVQTGWKRCTQCKGTGLHLEHLLYTVLALPIRPTPGTETEPNADAIVEAARDFVDALKSRGLDHGKLDALQYALLGMKGTR